jgi:siderophore synthetase component
MVAKKKTKNTNSSATRSVKEPEMKPFLPEVEEWLTRICKETNISRDKVVEALLFDVWEKSLCEPKFASEYKVHNARTKIQVRST